PLQSQLRRPDQGQVTPSVPCMTVGYEASFLLILLIIHRDVAGIESHRPRHIACSVRRWKGAKMARFVLLLAVLGASTPVLAKGRQAAAALKIARDHSWLPSGEKANLPDGVIVKRYGEKISVTVPHKGVTTPLTGVFVGRDEKVPSTIYEFTSVRENKVTPSG